jgi:predicted PilT family ATPase
VVMPITAEMKEKTAATQWWMSSFAKEWIEKKLKTILNSDFVVKMKWAGIELYIPEFVKWKIIWKWWAAITELEKTLWMSIKVRTFDELPLLDVKTDISGWKKWGQLFIAFPNWYESTTVTLLIGDNLIKYQTDRNWVIAINDRNEVRTIERRGFVVVNDK